MWYFMLSSRIVQWFSLLIDNNDMHGRPGEAVPQYCDIDINCENLLESTRLDLDSIPFFIIIILIIILFFLSFCIISPYLCVFLSEFQPKKIVLKQQKKSILCSFLIRIIVSLCKKSRQLYFLWFFFFFKLCTLWILHDRLVCVFSF